MVLRVVYKTGFQPLTIRSLSLNAIAFAGVSCILLLGMRILTPFDSIQPTPYPARLIADRSFIALSVDDFGRWADSVPLFPDSQFMRNHSALLIARKDRWYRRATVESADDLTRLEAFLTDLNKNVSFEQRAVLTPHWIVGGPDFEAMRASGCDTSPSPLPPLPPQQQQQQQQQLQFQHQIQHQHQNQLHLHHHLRQQQKQPQQQPQHPSDPLSISNYQLHHHPQQHRQLGQPISAHAVLSDSASSSPASSSSSSAFVSGPTPPQLGLLLDHQLSRQQFQPPPFAAHSDPTHSGPVAASITTSKLALHAPVAAPQALSAHQAQQPHPQLAQQHRELHQQPFPNAYGDDSQSTKSDELSSSSSSSLSPPAAATASGFETCHYREQLISDAGPTGLDQAPYSRGNLKPLYKSLWEKGLWHPEYHGRSHFSVSKWLRLLRTDHKAQQCFRENLVCATDTMQLRSEFNGFSDKDELKTWLEEGVNAFVSFWGYRPALISSPHNTWSTWLADVVGDLSFIGAELAEDQTSYLQHANRLSLHDRYRFDVFYPNFDCDEAIAEVVDLLKVPVKTSLANRWYQFLSFIDLFRVHRPPLHHGSAGDHRRFTSLMWHAQNAMGSTYGSAEHKEHTECLRRVVDTVRRESPRSVFVTGSELHQIRRQGWSREFWSDSIVYRNYGTHQVVVSVPDVRDLVPHSEGWRGVRNLYATELSVNGVPVAADGRQRRRRTEVGQKLILEADTVVRLRRE